MRQNNSNQGPLMAYRNIEVTQRLLPLNKIYRLEKKNTYVLINMFNEKEVLYPNGRYLFCVQSNAFTSGGQTWTPSVPSVYPDEENIMRVIPEPSGVPAHPGDGFGHTSMVQIKASTRSPVVGRVYYAGELTFQNGILVVWTNKSGHFRPADARESHLPAAVRRLLPLSLYRGW